MASFCSQCGAAIADDAKFCASCGTAVAPASEAQAQPAPPAEQKGGANPPYWPPPPDWDPSSTAEPTQPPPVSAGAAAPAAAPKKKSHKGRWIVVGVVAAIVIIAVAASQNGSDDSSATAKNAAAVAPTSPVTGKLVGVFHRDCLICSDSSLVDYVVTRNAWCGWQDGHVVVHVTMANTSIEHVTVHWHPSYVVAGGGEHGTGMTSIEDSGFDAGETRQLESKQSPKGVPEGAQIAECKPSFFDIESG